MKKSIFKSLILSLGFVFGGFLCAQAGEILNQGANLVNPAHVGGK